MPLLPILSELERLRRLYGAAWGSPQRKFVAHGEEITATDNSGGMWVCKCLDEEGAELISALLEFAQKL